MSSPAAACWTKRVMPTTEACARCAGMKADVFEHQHFAIAQGVALPFRAGTDAIQGKSHGLAEEFFQLLGGGPQRIFRIGTTLGTAKMRSENEARTLLDSEAQRGEGF